MVKPWILKKLFTKRTSRWNLLIKSIRAFIYNVAFANSERWLAKSRVDITRRRALTQLSVNTENLRFFVLYYLSIKHFRVDIQLYQHEWKLKKNKKLCKKRCPKYLKRSLGVVFPHNFSFFKFPFVSMENVVYLLSIT